MKTSATIAEISKALLRVQNDFCIIKKSTQGLRNKYASYELLIEKAKPILTKAGLVLMQPLDHVDGLAAVTTLLIHSESGEFIQSTCIITQMDDILNSQGKGTINSAQREGGGISYTKRYALSAMLAWATGDKDLDQGVLEQIDNELDLILETINAASTEQELNQIYNKHKNSKFLKAIIQKCGERKAEIKKGENGDN